jgi:Domain of unknown function (DUF4129)
MEDKTDQAGNTRYQDFLDDTWVRTLFRPLLISLLSASVVAGPLAGLRALTPWRLGYVLPLALFVAIEGVYSTLQRGRPQWRDRRGLRLRLAELVTILLVLRFAIWTFSTGLPGSDQFALWLVRPAAILDTQFRTVGVLLILAWGLAIGTTADFLELAIQPDEFAAYETHSWDESRSHQRASRAKSRLETVAQFAWRWGWGGALLVACAAFSRTSFGLGGPNGLQFAITGANLPPDIVVALLCYFISGLILLSEGRLAVLRGRWYNQGISVMPGVLKRWHLSSVLIILLVALVAALLPLGRTGPLATALEYVFGLIVRVGQVVLAFVFFLFTALLWPLRFLFPASDQQPPAQAPPRFEMPPPQQAASHLPAWLGGAIYWTLILAVLAYLLLSYLNAHGLLAGLNRGHWLRLRFWWSARWARLSASARKVTEGLRKRLRVRRPSPLAPGGPSIHVGGLPPAAKIRYFYLSTLQRAAQRGLARPPHKTPLEFGQDLTGQWPDAEVDFKELTEAFLAARYDRRAIPADRARAVQRVWQRALRSLRKNTGDKGEDQARD